MGRGEVGSPDWSGVCMVSAKTLRCLGSPQSRKERHFLLRTRLAARWPMAVPQHPPTIPVPRQAMVETLHHVSQDRK